MNQLWLQRQKLKNNRLALAGGIVLLLFWPMARAAELDLQSDALQFVNDISIQIEDVDAPSDIVVGKTIRLYATVHNNSEKDQKGVVRFYNERLQKFIGADQPFSAVAKGTDTVFIDIEVPLTGENPVAIRIIPDTPAGDDPANNKITSALIADHDEDQDGMSNRNDTDDDNDGAPDRQDVFPLDPQESEDNDQDGAGNNADPDDDNDDVSDAEDPFPENHGPVLVLGSSGAEASGGGGGGRSHRWGLDESISDSSSEDVSAIFKDAINNPKTEVTDSIQELPASSDPNRLTNLEGQAGEIMTFNTLQSYDPDGSISTITWDFGNGEIRSGPIVDYKFSAPGIYEIKVTITDNLGESRAETIPVRISYPWSPMWGVGLIFLVLGLLIGLKNRA